MARPRLLPQVPNNPLTPPEVYAVLSRVRPPDSVIVNESTSTMAQQIEWLPDRPDRVVLRHGQRRHRLGRPGRGRGRAG